MAVEQQNLDPNTSISLRFEPTTHITINKETTANKGMDMTSDLIPGPVATGRLQRLPTATPVIADTTGPSEKVQTDTEGSSGDDVTPGDWKSRATITPGVGSGDGSMTEFDNGTDHEDPVDDGTTAPDRRNESMYEQSTSKERKGSDDPHSWYPEGSELFSSYQDERLKGGLLRKAADILGNAADSIDNAISRQELRHRARATAAVAGYGLHDIRRTHHGPGIRSTLRPRRRERHHTFRAANVERHEPDDGSGSGSHAPPQGAHFHHGRHVPPGSYAPAGGPPPQGGYHQPPPGGHPPHYYPQPPFYPYYPDPHRGKRHSTRVDLAGGMLIFAGILGILMALMILVLSVVVQSGGIERFAASETITIEGSIIDENTGLPIPGANITIEGTARTATTNATGGFRLPAVSAGEVVIIIENDGYTTKRMVTYGWRLAAGEEILLSPGNGEVTVDQREDIEVFIEFIATAAGIIVPMFFMLSLITIAGGVAALRRGSYPLAVIGSITGIFAIGLGLGILLSLVALIILLVSGDDFRRAGPHERY